MVIATVINNGIVSRRAAARARLTVGRVSARALRRTTYAHAGSRPNWAHPHGGYSEGVNEFGVGIGNEHFHSHGLPTDDGAKPQAEFTDLTRLVLERTRTAAAAVQLLTELISEYGQTCKTCPVLANYNSMFMVTDTVSIYTVMAVGHEVQTRARAQANTSILRVSLQTPFP